MRFSTLLVLSITMFFYQCAPSRIIKPLDEGQQSISASLGGPMAQVPGVGTLPIPFTNVSYSRGFKHNLTATGSLYPTAALFGVYQIDLGANYGIVKKEKWGISSTLLLNNAIDQWEGHYKLWPNLDLNGYYELTTSSEKGSWLFYGGCNNWFELAKTGAHGRTQNTHWIFSPQVGAMWQTSKWKYQLEYKLIGPNLSNQNFVVSYSSTLPNTGANGLYISFHRLF